MQLLSAPPPPAVILAGGRARRMGGGDKALLPLNGQSLLDHIIARLTPQTGALALNANGDAARFARFALPVLPDPLKDYPGPLAGLLAGLDWAASLGSDRVLTTAGDTPFLPADLVERLSADPGEGPVLAFSRGRLHPTVGLWPTRLRGPLRDALLAGERRVGLWAGAQGAKPVAFPDTAYDPFFNINTPADLAGAADIARELAT